MRTLVLIGGVIFFSVIALAGCEARNVQSTAHFKVTFMDMDKVKPANESADFQFQVANLKASKQMPEAVVLHFANVDMDHGKNEVVAKKNSSGIFEASTILPMGGKWLVDVNIGDEKVEFPFQAVGQMK